MDYLQRILWHEGMFLTPNQFQQWDRLQEWRGKTVARMLQPHALGFAALEIDGEALSAGNFALRSAAGLLPDGTVFSMPEADPLPQPRAFTAHVTAQTDRLAVYLAVPAQRHGAPTSGDPARPGQGAVRYQRRTVSVRDDVEGGTERDLVVATIDARLCFSGEDLDGLTTLKVAEIVRSASGGFALSESFVPLCLAIGVSPWVNRNLRRIVDILCARATELAAQRRQRTQGMVEFSVSESANYLLLHTINGAIPALLHLLGHPQAHPEQLFLELARLAGQLHTFAGAGQAKDLPPYRHDDLGASFAALDERLRALLETNITARYVPLALVRGGGGIHAAKLGEAVLSGHRIYLSIASSAPLEKVQQQAAAKAKIASAVRVPLLITQALKGLGLTYLAVPPGEIPAQPGCSYFELQRSGDDWQQAVDTRSLSIYLPPDFTDLRMEFLAVKE